MSIQDPEPTAGGHVTVECYVRADAISDPVESRVESVRTLARSGIIDGYTVEAWPAEVVLSPLSEGTRAVERYRTFREWAAQWGVSVEPPFRRTTRRSELTGETRDVLRTPALCLAVHVDGRLREVFPHSSKGTTYDVADAVATLEGGVLTVDDSVAADPVGPRDCPRCDVPLATGQGVYSCPDCGWVGLADACGTVTAVDLGDPAGVADPSQPADATDTSEPADDDREDAESSLPHP